MTVAGFRLAVRTDRIAFLDAFTTGYFTAGSAAAIAGSTLVVIKDGPPRATHYSTM